MSKYIKLSVSALVIILIGTNVFTIKQLEGMADKYRELSDSSSFCRLNDEIKKENSILSATNQRLSRELEQKQREFKEVADEFAEYQQNHPDK